MSVSRSCVWSVNWGLALNAGSLGKNNTKHMHKTRVKDQYFCTSVQNININKITVGCTERDEIYAENKHYHNFWE